MNTTKSSGSDHQLPGEVGVWMFVLGDLLVFSLFFATYVFYRSESPLVYAQAQLGLDARVGTLNTLALLTSSWLLALAVTDIRAGQATSSKPKVLAAIALGVAFLVGKIYGYVGEVRAGLDPAETEFYTFYFVFTGIHFVHVLIGLALMALVIYSVKGEVQTEGRVRAIEGCAIYWHMVDILWIILFALFYLMP